LRSTSSTSRGSPPNLARKSIPASRASGPRCRCATGRAAATRTTRWSRPTTG
jgi:hypothetical protein